VQLPTLYTRVLALKCLDNSIVQTYQTLGKPGQLHIYV
jgi:hypothetical protein